MTKKEIEKIRKTALKLYEETGATAVYDYALTIEGIDYSYCTGCEADTPTLTDGKLLCECLVCGGSKE